MTLRLQNARWYGVSVLRALSPPVSSRKQSFGLKLAGAKKEVINQRVNRLRKCCNWRICWIANRKRSPWSASACGDWPYAGGRAKRILLDEPLSNLDAALRVQMRIETPVCINAWAAQ